MSKKGVLLINLGTPVDCDPKSVRRYLKQFLNDPRVIDLPWVIRYFLVNWLIIPRRYQKSAAAYQKIWLKGESIEASGSPLLVYSQAMKEALAIELGAEYQVELGMRYGSPSIKSAVEKLKDCDDLKVIPLFPQYAMASTGSAIAEFQRVISKKTNIVIQEDFFDHPGFIAAYAENIQRYIDKTMQNKKPDMLLLSYHGLPERHLRKAHRCYRTQCFATSALIAKALGLSDSQYTVSFQSRLGRTPWIKPFTDLILPELIEKGIRNIAIACPSFVADCLETLEEINIRAREQWRSLGGGEFTFIPCLNTEPRWIKAMAEIVGE